MDFAPLSGQESYLLGLVDKLSYKSDFLPILQKQQQNATPNDPTPSKRTKTISLRRYFLSRNYELKKSDSSTGFLQMDVVDSETTTASGKIQVGLVYLIGTIGRGDLNYGGTAVAKAIIDAARDKKVDAIVFRVGKYIKA
jgi:hypothetical protein